MSEQNIQDNTIAKYESYINDVLKEDLRIIEQRLQRINAEIMDLVSQKHTLKNVTDKTLHPSGFKTQVNLGCNVFMEGSVTDTSKVLFNVGLNHYLEFTVEETNKYIDLRIKAFESKAKELRDQSSKTKAHIKLMLFGIGEIRNENSKTSLNTGAKYSR